ncbi:lysoplasmalogenase family protein [Tsuneonella sp. HG249]
MPRRALIAHRPWLVVGIAMALAFWTLSGGALGELFLIILKGGSVAALAAYAFARSKLRDARMIAAVMTVGAMGDVAIELSTVAGGVFFLLSHLVAIALYLRNRWSKPTSTQKAAAIALLLGVPVIAWVLTEDLLIVAYSLALAAMAATAWLSRFSRYNVGIGALLFVASDLLIFARIGSVLTEDDTEWFVWPLYYAGQFLIVTGVMRTLRRDHAA